MPYSLKGNSVVKSSTGEVVKTHPTREKALAHLRALKANVRESSPAVLGALLEGAFDEAKHPRDVMGRWIATFDHPVHGRVSMPVSAASTEGARQAAAFTGAGTLQSLVPHDEAAKAIGRREDAERAGLKESAVIEPLLEGVGDRVQEGFAPDSAAQQTRGKFTRGDQVRVRAKGADSVTGRIHRFHDDSDVAVIAPEGGGPHVEAPVKHLSFDTPARKASEDRKRQDDEHHARTVAWQAARPQRGVAPPAERPAAAGGRAQEGVCVLLEGYDPAEARGWHGRWVGKTLQVFHGSSKITEVSHSDSRERMLSAVQGAVRARPGRPAIDRAGAQRVVDLAAGEAPAERAPAFRGLGATPFRDRASPAPSSDRHRGKVVQDAIAAQRGVIAAEKAARAARAPKVREGLSVVLEAFGAPPPTETPAQSQVRGAAQVKADEASLASGWSSSKHPRAQGGKFSYTTGGKRATRSSLTSSRTISEGASGALVKSIQRQLHLPADGVYGPNTRAAVVRFQSQHHLQVDGIVGRQTIAALRGNPNARTITPGPIKSTTATVKVHPTKRTKRAAQAPVRYAGGSIV